ncbi:hypothetical protein E6O75_ATG06286 [Venturia nashicola]|uniref:Uncharacterized protein n=1 Tax=Venturia nashicola TaxID=86259 RepID=A0A4Z1P237_9PEZI|nr:hypothetical protein E6O75_ATG06286 [Venturia nashicola]
MIRPSCKAKSGLDWEPQVETSAPSATSSCQGAFRRNRISPPMYIRVIPQSPRAKRTSSVGRSRQEPPGLAVAVAGERFGDPRLSAGVARTRRRQDSQSPALAVAKTRSRQDSPSPRLAVASTRSRRTRSRRGEIVRPSSVRRRRRSPTSFVIIGSP